MQTIVLKHSTTPGAPVPTLTEGEMALNVADNVLFVYNDKTLSPLTLKTINGESIIGTGNINAVNTIALDRYADINHTHNIDQIQLVGGKRFLTDAELSKATTVSDTMYSNNADVVVFENEGISNLNDYKVRLTESGSNKFLEDFIDDAFNVNNEGKLTVVKLSGSSVTLQELNALSGIGTPLQGEIDKLKNMGRYVSTVQTYQDLTNISANENDSYVVINDETMLKATSIYTYKNSIWVLQNSFKGYIRDFVKDPIDLRTEVTGTVSRSMFPAQMAVDTAIQPSVNITSTNVEDALAELINALK